MVRILERLSDFFEEPRWVVPKVEIGNRDLDTLWVVRTEEDRQRLDAGIEEAINFARTAGRAVLGPEVQG